MKFKSAHIFLAAASLVTLTVLAGCGSNTSGDLTSPGYAPGQLFNTGNGILSVQISPRSASVRIASNTQLQALGGLDNGQTADVSSKVTWTSSNNAVATVSATGVVTAVTPGSATITATAGSATDSIPFTVNPTVNRLYISDNNATNPAIRVFPTDSTGTVSPLRSIVGNNTGLVNPNQLLVNGQELFVSDATGNSVRVFSLHAEGNVAPLRVLQSASINGNLGIAVLNNELYVSNANGSIAVFNATDSGTAVTPKRLITGANTRLAGPGFLTTLDNNRVLTGEFTNKAVLGFTPADNGNVAPTINLTGPGGTLFAGPIGALVSGTDLWVSDTAGASLYRFATTANNNDAPLATISGANTGFTVSGPRSVAVLGNEVFVSRRLNNVVSVFPTNANGNVAPTRTFTSNDLTTSTSLVIGSSF